jgi:hypothetical protein
MDQTTLNVIISASAGFFGAVAGTVVSYLNVRRGQRLEETKLLASWHHSAQAEDAKVRAYIELWKCLAPISTRNPPDEIVSGLPEAQQRLQDWYYGQGGGLLIAGSVDPTTAKGAFFGARDLHSHDPLEIWRAFHGLRRAIRRDLGIYEEEADERASLEQARKRLERYREKAGV